MIDTDRWDPPARVALHTLPGDGAFLAPPREAALPEPRDLKLKALHGLDIERYAIIAIVAQQHRAQPSALFGDGLVPSPLKLDFGLGQLSPKPLRDCPPFDPKRAFPGPPTHVGKAQEIKGFGFSQTPLLSSLPCKATKLDQARFVWMQLQAKVRKTTLARQTAPGPSPPQADRDRG